MRRFLTSVANVIEWTIIGWALLMTTGALDPAGAAECNCVAYSIDALKALHIRLKTVPSIAVNDWFKHPGAYARGVVNVRDIEDCHTLLHEFVHHAQWLKYGDAKTLQENWQREMDAAQTTMLAEIEFGRPQCN